MNVLISAHNIIGIGSALRAYSLARWLVKAGHAVTILASRNEPGLNRLELVQDGVRLIQMPDIFRRRTRNGGLSPMDLVGRLGFVLRERFDIVHAFEPRPCATFPALVARRRFGTPFVADWCDLWGLDGIAALRGPLGRNTLGRVDDWLERSTRVSADAVVGINRYLAERAQSLGVPANRVRLVGVGANHDLIQPLSKAIAREKLNLPPSAQIVVQSGFSIYDVALLAETFICLARHNPKVLLLVSGGELPHFQETMARAGVLSQVKHLGFVPFDALNNVLAAGDVMIVPYTNRLINIARLPNRLGDYLAAGRPTVTNLTGELGRIVSEEGVGAIAPETPAEFAAVIQELLDDPDRCEALGKRARHLAETKYSWREWAKVLEGFYRELLG